MTGDESAVTAARSALWEAFYNYDPTASESVLVLAIAQVNEAIDALITAVREEHQPASLDEIETRLDALEHLGCDTGAEHTQHVP